MAYTKLLNMHITVFYDVLLNESFMSNIIVKNIKIQEKSLRDYLKLIT